MTPLVKRITSCTSNNELKEDLHWFDCGKVYNETDYRNHTQSQSIDFRMNYIVNRPYPNMVMCFRESNTDAFVSIIELFDQTVIEGCVAKPDELLHFCQPVYIKPSDSYDRFIFTVPEPMQDDIDSKCVTLIALIRTFLYSIATSGSVGYTQVPKELSFNERKRAKEHARKGKKVKPDYEWKTVIIEPRMRFVQELSESNSISESTTNVSDQDPDKVCKQNNLSDPISRANPRHHERRGHWRNLMSGKKVFVKSCEVGSKELGFIEKDYLVSGEVDNSDVSNVRLDCGELNKS